MKKLEDLAKEKGTAAHVLAGAKTFNGWGQGHELSDADYDKGIEAFEKIEMGGSAPPTEPEEKKSAVFNDYAKKPKKTDT